MGDGGGSILKGLDHKELKSGSSPAATWLDLELGGIVEYPDTFDPPTVRTNFDGMLTGRTPQQRSTRCHLTGRTPLADPEINTLPSYRPI